MEISLNEMTEADYDHFISTMTVIYADNKYKNGDWTLEESLEKAARSYAFLLPDRLATKNNYLMNIRIGSQQVGYLWFAVRKEDEQPVAFLYEIFVFEEYRNRGYGAQAMHCFVGKTKDLAVKRIMLHVFGFNKSAVRFYERFGFSIADYTMQYLNK